ncbi:hypothetical protein E9976_20325 [Salmonella enterica]|nr:hypothetical protein [Salmonella enterica subsp. enterica serovar Hvittingfoss]
MKKLIIAAGIAAATMASFNASASYNYGEEISHASVNSQVTGDSVVTVTGQNGGSFSTDQIKTAGQDLGTFNIQLPAGATGFGISKIHSHGFPVDFGVTFGGTCNVTVKADKSMEASEAAENSGSVPQQCLFNNSVTSVAVTTGSNNTELVVVPGTKTITADFTAYTN